MLEDVTVPDDEMLLAPRDSLLSCTGWSPSAVAVTRSSATKACSPSARLHPGRAHGHAGRVEQAVRDFGDGAARDDVAVHAGLTLG